MSHDTTRAAEIERVRITADRIARRMGKTFVLDPEKLARLRPDSAEDCPDCGEPALPVMILVLIVVVLAWVVS